MKRHLLIMLASSLAIFTMPACSDDDNSNGAPEKSYKIGDLYNSGGVKGIVYMLSDEAGKHGLVLSLDEISATWATEAVANVATGAINQSNGEKNMDIIKKIESWQTKYPAFAWCDAKNAGDIKGWFLPAFDQYADLAEVYYVNVVAFNKYLTDNGGTAITKEVPYWASNENQLAPKVMEAAYLKFTQEPTNGFKNKAEEARVRAIRAF